MGKGAQRGRERVVCACASKYASSHVTAAGWGLADSPPCHGPIVRVGVSPRQVAGVGVGGIVGETATEAAAVLLRD